MFIWKITFALGFAGLAAPALAEEDPPAVAGTCESCHGEAGVSPNPIVPSLAGQPYTLIEDNLLAFRSGRRACVQDRNEQSPSALLAQTMCATVSGLTDAEISELASYFERQEFEPAVQTVSSDLSVQGETVHFENGCEGCHSKGGKQTNAMAPILAGQWAPYLRRALEGIRSGQRAGPKVMNTAIRAMDEREIEALVQYYANRADRDAQPVNP